MTVKTAPFPHWSCSLKCHKSVCYILEIMSGKGGGATEHVDLVRNVRDDAIRCVSFVARKTAVKLERFDLMKQIIKAPKKHVGCGPDKQWRRTWLHMACMEGHLEAVTCLLEAGAEINKTDDVMRIPLIYAIMCGKYEIVDLLIQQGADVHHNKCLDKYTPLVLAAEYGYPDIMKLLIDNGADMHLLAPCKMTLVHIICQAGHPVEMLDILFDRKFSMEINLDAKDIYGRTAVRMLKDALDRHTKPLNNVSLAVRANMKPFRKLYNRIMWEIEERKRLKYYDELKQREKLEAKEKRMNLINQSSAIADLERKIQEKIEAMNRGETVDEHEREDWHHDLMSQKVEEDNHATEIAAEKQAEEERQKEIALEEERKQQELELYHLMKQQDADPVLQAKRKKVLNDEIAMNEAKKRTQQSKLQEFRDGGS